MNTSRLFVLTFIFLSPISLNAVIWNNTTITNNVTDDNISISGNNTLANDITVTANTTDITITIVGNASLSDDDNNLTLHLVTTSTLRTITMDIDTSVLSLSNSLTLRMDKSVVVQFNGGKLSACDQTTILADPLA